MSAWVWTRRVALLIAFAGLVALVAGCDSDSSSGDDNGDRVPNFTLYNQFGVPVSLYDYQGKVVLLDFSAVWCSPCKSEARAAEQLYQTYKDQGFELITILIQDASFQPADQQDCADWAQTYGLTFNVCYDSNYVVYNQYNVEDAVPLNVILDRDLVVRYSKAGYYESELIGVIEGLL